MKKTIVAAVSVVAIAAAVPLVVSAGSDRHGKGHERAGHHEMRGKHGGFQHRGAAKMRFQTMRERFDADDDGAITQDEIDAWREARLRAFDADADGQLSLDEYEALWLDAMRERMVGRFQAHDDDGDGRVTVDEFAEPTAHVVLMRDRNEDGVLDRDDMRRKDRRSRGERPMPPAATDAPQE